MDDTKCLEVVLLKGIKPLIIVLTNPVLQMLEVLLLQKWEPALALRYLPRKNCSFLLATLNQDKGELNTIL